ncbi:MAG: hypothetical protein JW807_06495 [Spirochaetes bacterium]|nr:hypothetical protein [Spirochaetota bacterium]
MYRFVVLLIASSIAAAGCAAPGATQIGHADSSSADVETADDSRDECLKAIRRARLDARSGLYRMYVYRPRGDAAYIRVLGEYMKTVYGIELFMYGPEDRNRDRCYSNEMDKIILNTFGPDIFAKAEQEARRILYSPK